MIKRILFTLLILSMTLFFTACAESFPKENQNIVPAAAGTYLGEDGCVISIFPDGTVDYFFRENDMTNRGLLWTYTNDHRILIDYCEQTPIYAECDDLSSTDYYFKGYNEGYWIDEAYTKLDNTPKHMTGDECRTFLKENWEKYYPETARKRYEEMENITTDDVMYGDVKFHIPSTLVHVNENGLDCFVSRDLGALLLFDVKDSSYPLSKFDSYVTGIDTVVLGKVQTESSYVEKETSETHEVAKLQARQNTFRGTNTNLGDFHCKTDCLNNCYKDKLIYIYFYYSDEAQIKYDTFYKDLLNSAVLTTPTAYYKETPYEADPAKPTTSSNTKWCQYEPANSFINRYNSRYPDEPITKSSIIGDYMFGTEIQVNDDILFDVGETDGDPSYTVEGFKKLDINNREKFWEYANRLSNCSNEFLFIDEYYGDIFPCERNYEYDGMSYHYEENPNAHYTMKLRIHTSF